MCRSDKTKISALFWVLSDIPSPFSYSAPILLIKMNVTVFRQLNLVQHILLCPREDTAPYTIHIEAKLAGLIQNCTLNFQSLSSSCKELSTKTNEIKGKSTCQKIMVEQGPKKHRLGEGFIEPDLKCVFHLELDTNLSVKVAYRLFSAATV